MENHQLKEELLKRLYLQLDHKAETLRKYINSAKESRDSETKSSVGDKYETGRAMAQMELEKNQVQLNNIENQRKELQNIKLNWKYTHAEFGSIIYTTNGNYFLSIGFGQIKIENESFFCISASSPIGQELLNKSVEESFIFQKKECIIKNVF